MRRRLLITGATGFVAGSVVRQADDTWELHALSSKPAPLRREGLVWHTLDLLDDTQLSVAFERVRPDSVVHAAAIADIDKCEQQPQLADCVNVRLTESVARLCNGLGTRMVHLSTDTVFDGSRGNYIETDPPGPVNHYARTKVASEQIVMNLVGDHVVARLALVMGFPVFEGANTFLPRMIDTLQQGRTFGVPDDEIRTPVDVVTLGRALLELAGSDVQGFIHLAGNDALPRFEMARRIALRLGFSPDLIVVKNASETPGRAPRPRNVSLSNSRARATLRTPMLGLEPALDLVMAARDGGKP